MKTIVITLLNVCFSFLIFAQQSVNANGGDFASSAGKVSYSVGQMANQSFSSSTGSVQEGVQQPYQIKTVTGIQYKNVQLLRMSVFPNPTIDYLTLKVEDESNLENFDYHFFDTNGKMILMNNLKETTTKITLEGLPVGNYFLSVIKNNIPIKTFKIIKQ